MPTASAHAIWCASTTHKSPLIAIKEETRRHSECKLLEVGLWTTTFCPTIKPTITGTCATEEFARYCKCHKTAIKYCLRKKVIWHIFIMSKLRLRKTANKSLYADICRQSQIVQHHYHAQNSIYSIGKQVRPQRPHQPSPFTALR